MKVAIIGAGAAGCFAAGNLARMAPGAEITVYEAARRPMAKLARTGGGRCNLTNSFASIDRLEQAYPRGARLMRRLLAAFSAGDAMRWFEAEGVALVTQEDGCVFPRSQDAMQIVRCLENLMRRGGVQLRCEAKVTGLGHLEDGRYRLDFKDGSCAPADMVLVTAGGFPSPSGLGFLSSLGLETVPPVPSLFSLRVEGGIRGLMGTVVPASVSLRGTSFKAEGPLLITDWGLSGPAVLKLSSYAARALAQSAYRGEILVNWLPALSEEQVRSTIGTAASANPRKLLQSLPAGELPARLWAFLLSKAGLRGDLRCAELGSKGLSRLSSLLHADAYALSGRAAFREEFVTCGGVALGEISSSTLESKKHPGLFFAGEVLDIDAITGGFNLTAAWSGGWVAAGAMASRINESKTST